MEKQPIYTPMEQVLIQSALLAQALETKKKLAEAAKADLLLLELEEQVGQLDGLPEEAWLL